MSPFSCSCSFEQLSPVYIFRNIRATFPSGVKNDCLLASTSCFSLPDRKSLPSHGEEATSLSCPTRSFRKMNSRVRKNSTPEMQCLALFQKKSRTFDMQINFAPPDCPKSPRETEILHTYIQGYKARSEFSILTEE